MKTLSWNARKNLACKANIAKLFFLSCLFERITTTWRIPRAVFDLFQTQGSGDRNANLTEQVKRAMKYRARVWLA